MRYKHGYICLEKFEPSWVEYMFGQNAGSCPAGCHYENLETSNLSMFLTLLEAQRAKQELEARDGHKGAQVSMAEVELTYALTAEELEIFRGRDHLVVIVINPDFRGGAEALWQVG